MKNTVARLLEIDASDRDYHVLLADYRLIALGCMKEGYSIGRGRPAGKKSTTSQRPVVIRDPPSDYVIALAPGHGRGKTLPKIPGQGPFKRVKKSAVRPKGKRSIVIGDHDSDDTESDREPLNEFAGLSNVPIPADVAALDFPISEAVPNISIEISENVPASTCVTTTIPPSVVTQTGLWGDGTHSFIR